MKIKSLKKGKKNMLEIVLQDNTTVSLYEDIIVKYSLIPKKELSEKEFVEIQKENATLESYYMAIRHLTTKLRTKKEMKQYLTKNGMTPSAITNTIERLTKEGYLNDENYIQSFLNDSFRFSNDGPLKIKRKLVDNGLELTKIEKILSELPKEEWLVKLEKIYQKKADSHHNDGLEKWKLKCMQYLMQLGYPKEWIEECSNRITWSEDDTILEKEYTKLMRILSRKYQDRELIFRIQRKLYEKGFSKEKIDEMINKKIGEI